MNIIHFILFSTMFQLWISKLLEPPLFSIERATSSILFTLENGELEEVVAIGDGSARQSEA